MAQRMEENGEPVVDQGYFRNAVAKAILWRTAEKLFDALDLEGYRANSVAYATALLAERSGRRIDLGRIWGEQRCSPALCEAVKAAVDAAHEHITRQEGNPGEASKREACWRGFCAMEIALPADWGAEFADAPFLPANSEEEALAAEWERVRHGFIEDSRTMGELEAVTGIAWVASRRGDPVSLYAKKSWGNLRSPGMGTKKAKTLVAIFAAAHSA